ncbi:MAG: CoA transferase [Pseudomonadota bacterium]
MSTLPEFKSWHVVEFAGEFGPAMLAGKLFADLGCTVTRLHVGAQDDAALDACDAELIEMVSRGKKPLQFNPQDREALACLLGRADVLVADRTRLMQLAAALDTSSLCASFPMLTVLACTWFGMEGPMAGWHGSEEVVQAATGIMSVTAPAGGTPTRIAGAPMALAAAMYGVTSAIGAVLRRRDGEHGTLLDVSAYDAALSFHSSSLPVYFLTGQAPAGVGNRHRMWAPWNSFQCADGWVIVCTGSHANWVRLCETMGRPEMPSDPLYAKPEDRLKNIDALEAQITAWTSTRPVQEVERVLNDAAIAAGSILCLHDVLTHPQFVERNLIDAASTGRHAGPAFHLNRAPLGAGP